MISLRCCSTCCDTVAELCRWGGPGFTNPEPEFDVTGVRGVALSPDVVGVWDGVRALAAGERGSRKQPMASLRRFK